jgi:hypothetical protein
MRGRVNAPKASGPEGDGPTARARRIRRMHIVPLLSLRRSRSRPFPVVPPVVLGIAAFAAIVAGLGATFSGLDAQGTGHDLPAARYAHTQAPEHGHAHAHGHAEAHDPPTGAASALVLDRERRALHLEAVLQRRAFEEGGPPDGRYHALVNRAGGAAAKALFVTDITDAEIARALRDLGADDGGGVPLRAWTLRNVPLLPQPSARVKGSRVDVTVHWEGAERRYDIGELLLDSGGQGVEMRFGGNEEHDAHWDSGCIVCLFSCPGGVISNARYSIREHVGGATRFSAGPELPEDGTPVTITLHLSPE